MKKLMLSALLMTAATQSFAHSDVALTAENIAQCFATRVEVGEEAVVIKESLIAKIAAALEANEITEDAARVLLTAIEAL
jgi:hypothetical protein